MKRTASLSLDWEDELTASRHASRKATRRVASLDLDWKRCPYDFAEYEAQLPEIPGYPGTGDGNALAYIAPKDREYIFWLTIAVTYDDVVTLTNKDFGISSSDSSVDMEQAVESLSVEEIADALQAEGYEPFDDATASRHASSVSARDVHHASKRTAHFDLDWKKYYNSHGAYYEAMLPSVPGYTAPGYMTSTIVWGSVNDPNLWTFLISLAGIDDGRMPTLSTVQLNADDFGISDGATAEEMMDAVENLSMDDIVRVLTAKGYLK